MTDETTTYHWVQDCGGRGRPTGAAHAVTTRLPNSGSTTTLVCGKSFPAVRVVGAAPSAAQCKSCLRNIENGTGWA